MEVGDGKGYLGKRCVEGDEVKSECVGGKVG